MTKLQPNISTTNIVFYDGICKLCNGLVTWLIKKDTKKELFFMSLQSEQAKKILSPFKIDTTQLDSIIYYEAGMLYKKSSAVLKILNKLGKIWKLTQIFWLIPCTIRNLIYNLVAKFRYKLFGKYSSCQIPTPNIKDRFL
jgi:predicted DCC family thiol-disulfide oxidoreductase YuxK